MSFTFVFPLLAALAVFAWFVYWAVCHSGGGEGLVSEKGFRAADWICMLAVTAVYAFIGFYALGDTTAPESFLEYSGGGYYALIELDEPTEISALRYYSGLGAYDYQLEFSADGEDWIPQQTEDGSAGMTQSYTQLFRWNDAVLNSDNGPIRFIRIISGGAQSLGEIALYDESGALIDADRLTLAAGCEALTDEPETIAECYTYLNGTYFDEIYHARTAYEHIKSVWPYEITHPPLGKLIIGLGIRLFGMTPFGWRFTGTLFGVMMLPALYVFLKKLFSDTLVCTGGTAVLAFDFLHYTQTRIATIDSYVTFFILLMFLFMWLWLTEHKHRLLWLALCGLSFGLGAASKWTGFYAGAGLGILWLCYWIRRVIRERQFCLRSWGINILWCLLFFIVVPGLIYYLSYYAYGTAQGMQGPGMFFTREYAKTVWDNQKYMWEYHSKLVAEHPYSSRWYQWILDARPILYYLQSYSDGTHSAFGAFNNPLISWAGILAMVAMGMKAGCEHDRRAGFILFGYLVNLVPWIPVSRLTFAYHYFPCTLFLVLAIASLFADFKQSGKRWPVWGYAAACGALFIMFYPVLSGARVSDSYATNFLKWFSSWPF